MGAHFDLLCDIVEKRMTDDDTFAVSDPTFPWGDIKEGCEDDAEEIGNAIAGMGSPRKFLKRTLVETALFDLPINSNEIAILSRKESHTKAASEDSEFVRYINDYLNMSGSYGFHMLRPFGVTGIEDNHSFVSMVSLGGSRYVVVISVSDHKRNNGVRDLMLDGVVIGYVRFLEPKNNQIPMIAVPIGAYMYDEFGHRIPPVLMYDAWNGLQRDVASNATSYMEEIVYIMDPDNFIIREESPNSRQVREKIRSGGKFHGVRKTSMRPHYICRSERDTAVMFSDHSKIKYPAHPVRGHWRVLQSERYVYKRGQRIFVEQYWTGDGLLHADGGTTYQVYIKKDPATLVPYKRIKETVHA